MARAYWIAFYRSIRNPGAVAAHDCAGYQEALKALGRNAVEREIRIVEGLA